MQDVEEVVLMTITDQKTDDVSSVKEEEDVKSVLVTTELSQHMGEEVVEIAPEDLDVESCTADALSKQEAVYVKLTEEVDVESDIYYPITCGDTKAILVWKKFVCPGINIKCIQLNEQLVSPKEFVCLAGKSTLKDWKRAIRLNGTMLRKIMDSGELEFYQHAKVCSNTCRSTKIDLVGSKLSAISQQSAEFIAVTPSSTILNGQSPSFSDAEESSEWVTAIGEDSVVFWCGVKQAGLLDDVVDDFRTELKQLLTSMHERVSEPPLLVKDVNLLDNIVQNFGMLDLVKKVLARHKSQMDHYREQYTQSLAALEQQCDEHRKRAKELKSKAQHLDNVLMTFSPAPSPPAPKHPRLSRCLSAPPAASPPPPQITLSLNQLAGLGKVFTLAGSPVAGNPLGGYTVLSPGGPAAEQAPLCHPSNLTLLSAAPGGPEGGGAVPMTFLKVLGPQYQLLTLPSALGGTLQGAGVAQSAAAPRPLGSSVALHAQVGAPAGPEVCCVGDPQKVAVETESEEDQEC
ncbi:unnamed protein product [Arctogadus glacialis]